MENTALNGTTNATKDHEDWKKKKGYGPILVVAVSLALLLGLSIYSTVGPVDGGTTLPPPLPRDEKGMTNAVASSSSTSLVGSGTAQGGSSAHCEKNTGYNCGAVFPPDGDTCGHKGCCCQGEDGTGLKMNSCDNAKGYAYRGCNSCWGKDACFKTNNINAGTNSCQGYKSCRGVSDSTIDNDSCDGKNSCRDVSDSTIGVGSCFGYGSCDNMQNATIGNGSCKQGGSNPNTMHYSCESIQNAIIGNGSCNSGSENGGSDSNGASTGRSCESVENAKIGNNSCNGDKVCYECKHNVPDNACNQGITDDMNTTGYCNFCM